MSAIATALTAHASAVSIVDAHGDRWGAKRAYAWRSSGPSNQPFAGVAGGLTGL